eukprot:g10200.t1
MDMDGYVGTSSAPLSRGSEVSFFSGADDEGVHSAATSVRGVGYFAGGGGFVARNGAAPSPSEANAIAEAALAASYCSIPSGDVVRDRHQPQRRSVYDSYPQAPSSWIGDGSRGGEGEDLDWRPRHHRGSSWQAIGQEFEDDHEERMLAVGIDSHSAGARSHGDRVSKKRPMGMDALEQELLERAQYSKRMRAATGPPQPMTYGMVFPPPTPRDLVHLEQQQQQQQQQQQNPSCHIAKENVSTNPGTIARASIDVAPEQPIDTARRIRGGGSTHQNTPSLPTTHADQQEHQRPDSEEPVERSQEPVHRRASGVVGTKTPKIGKRGVGNRCEHPGCSRGATFGPRGGARRPTNCAAHKREGMVKITSRQCAEDLCSTAPSYGFKGKRATVCSRHKEPGMVNVVTPRCQRDHCGSCASYGHMSERRPLFCARHAEDGMVNVVSRKCLGVGCLKNPSYGHPGDRRASFCVDHHLAGMSNIVSPKCLAAGCNKAPSFGNHGAAKATWCKAHKQGGMVNLLYSRQLQKGLARKLVAAGAEIGDALHEAVGGGNGGIAKDLAVEVLIEAGAGPDARNTSGCAPLHFAATVNTNLQAVLALLRHDAKDKGGETPLHVAARQALAATAWEVVDALVRSGAEENIVDNEGYTSELLVTSCNDPRMDERAKRVCGLLANAPADRAWRRQGYLVLCRAHLDRLEQA